MPLPEALAFDVYGTLVDPLRVREELEQVAGEHAPAIARVWRQTQLEYTFRLTAMERYEDFEWVTHRALHQAIAVAGVSLEAAAVDRLMAAYDRLERFDDVAEGLDRLHAAGHTLAILSNGTPRMLERLVLNSGLPTALLRLAEAVEQFLARPPGPARRFGRLQGEPARA